MKIVLVLIALFPMVTCLGQTVAAPIDSSRVILFEDFNNNKNNWTVGSNKNVSSSINRGIYYLTAEGSAYGEAHEVNIDTRKDFEIETRIKIVSGNSEHKNHYSMLFWGREAWNGYYFTFSGDGFASVQSCDGKKQSDCVTKKGSFQKTNLNPGDFNVYLIRKVGSTYSFFINGKQFFEMPFAPFFGNLIGFGAGRKVSLAIDYLKVIYL
ncbi:MAG TPA: hypothetical protein VFZ47_03100 [Chitinophagaceae bacterium]